MTQGIKTYKLVEIPVNGPVISAGAVCPILPHQDFIIGEKYRIITRVLDKLFVCKAYIDIPEENPDECLDIVIMKQIGGYNNGMWPLSESDCEFLHINYEKGLQVFPATYDFKKVVQ